ncbi:MAG TPA: POTRA domain-containing protein [Terriglobales bacterium]|nr:POTRA domain-containing protein [Terriglobales bacterium]
MQLTGTLVRSAVGRALASVSVGVLLAFLCATALAQNQAPEQTFPLLSAIADYQDLPVGDIEFRGVESHKDQAELRQMVVLKPGEPLERAKLRESIQALYSTGRFSDIQVEAEHTPDHQVTVVFLTTPNYFVGEITVEGAPGHPTDTQIINASKLQLGELLTREEIERARVGISDLMEQNGYYRSQVSDEEQPDAKTQQVAIRFKVSAGERAHVGSVTITGKTGYSPEEIREIANIHPGDTVSADGLTNALQRLRKKYQKKNRLLAQVTVNHVYRPEKNAVDYTFDIDPGPVVEVAVEGFHLSRRLIRKYIPVYEENALDEDLLNEGRRNLLDYLQTRGFFEAKVAIKRESAGTSNDRLRVSYVVDPGPRHKLVKIGIEIQTLSPTGIKYFDEADLRSRMQVQPAGRLFSHGRYSQSLLASDIRGLEALYRAQGFAQVKITSNLIDNYGGVPNQLAVQLQVDEGPQTLVGALHIMGNKSRSEDELRSVIYTQEGQPFSDYYVSNDRDSILNDYFNHGFPNASFEASAKPMEGQPYRMDVTFTVHEGDQVFVDQVLLSGLYHTRPYIVQRQLQVHPGDPVSQIDMLDTQRRLYDLSIFNQVDTAVQNPDGKEREKNILVNVREAKRYTFNYGVGLEFQTGQPTGGASPTGRTGVSPRVSFEVTRLNFRGRNHTIAFKSHVGRLQQRALLSYDAPRWFNSDNLRLTFTTFYDNTLDVTTFTSRRLEGSVQAEQKLSKASTLFYRFQYRRVQAANFASNFSPNQVPLLSQPTRVGMPGFSYIRNRRDSDLESTRGSYTTLDAGVAAGYFGSEANFSRLLVQNSTYHLFKKKYVFARSTTIGMEDAFGNTVILSPAAAASQTCGTSSTAPPCPPVIPLPERFFSGGGNSHRGFGLNQAGPRDPQSGFPVGGSALFLNNLELRFPPVTLPWLQDNLSFAIFHDSGNVFDTGHDMLHSLLRWHQKNPQLCMQQSTYKQCDFNYVSHAIGVGVRYKTPIGPVRFDFGYNLNPPSFPSFVGTAPNQVFAPKQASPFNVYFSIGQTF